MRTRQRGAFVRGGTTALTLALLASLLTAGLLVAPARAEDPAANRAMALLDQTIGAFLPKPERTGRAPLPRTDVGLLLRDLRASRADLSPAERLIADQYLARPSVGEDCKPGGILNPESVLRSTHFCIHYKTSTATVDQAKRTATILEQVWAREIDQLGFRAPLPDDDGIFDVTLRQLGNQGIYGYCTTDTAAAQSSAYCVLDNDFSAAEYGAPPINSLRVTAAHEFFHAIQFAYDATEPVWLLEGTAVWAEDQVYPTINDYLQYLTFSPIREPATPVDGDGAFERYGIVVFWKFLTEYLKDPSVIRQLWRYADAPTGRDALTAVVDVLKTRKRAFGPTFARFAGWNTRPPGSYGDRLLFPAPRWNQVLTLRPAAPGTGPLAVVLDHLSSAPFLIKPGAGLRTTARLRVSVAGPSKSSQPQALVQVRYRSGAVDWVLVPLNANGDGSVGVPFGRKVRSVVVTLSNASTQGLDDQAFTLRARVVR